MTGRAESDSRERVESPGAPTSIEACAWLLLPIVFWPTLSDLAGHMRQEGWAAYSIVFAGLCLREVAVAERRQLDLRGVALVAAAVLGQVGASLGGRPSLARPALALAVVGVGRAFRSSRGTWPLAFLAIPVPVSALRPPLAILDAVLGALGMHRAIAGGAAQRGVIELDRIGLTLRPEDTGGPVALLVGGLAWYVAQRRDAGPGAQLAAFARGAGMGLLMQAAALALALGLARTGRADAGQVVLASGAWALAAAWIARAIGRSGVGSSR